MSQSKEFMLLFRFDATQTHQPTEAELAEQNQQWGSFIGNIAMQDKLVSTHHLGFEGKEVSADKSVTDGIYVAQSEMLGGNMIIRAASIDEAVEISKDCPILAIGGRVEVREILPM
ncbi:MAG: YciI family protein [Bacteroidia bacterium]